MSININRMFENKFKLELEDISQLVPPKPYVYDISPLNGKPWFWECLNVLDRDLKVQDKLYFQFKGNWYELVCFRRRSLW